MTKESPVTASYSLKASPTPAMSAQLPAESFVGLAKHCFLPPPLATSQ